jgi:DNA-binding response OmpR family regulator
MDYTPLDPTILGDDAILTEATTGPWSSFPGRPRQSAGVLRYRGMVMNTLTGSILVHGRPTRLATKEREMLAALMRRSGQIVSPKWLAMQLHTTIEEIDALAQALNTALCEAGAQCLPRKVEGLGYVLWR